LEGLVLCRLGSVRHQQERYQEAAALFRACLALKDRITVKERGEGLIGLALTLTQVDSTEAGLALLESAAAPLAHPMEEGTAALLNRNAGHLLLELGRYREAADRLERADRTCRAANLSTDRIAVLSDLGRCYRLLARPDSAMAVLTEAVRVWEAHRMRSRDPEWREQMGAHARVLYTHLADLMLSYPPEVPAAERIRSTFDALQVFKARTLRERMLGPAAARDPAVRASP
jgi:tetratricopeptide (TPR) repeat protein